MFGKFKKIHFVGIGGVGMSGIAEVLNNLGLTVSGSDMNASDYTRRLEKLGASIYIGHKKENVGDADLVIWSSAIKNDNPELEEARQRNIPIIRRAEMLAELMRLKKGIAIAGTHGKTTTTSLISLILSDNNYDPTIVIGGKFNNIGSGAKLGKGEYLVAEADESDGTFLKLFPTYAVVTNIDTDHLDYYGSIEAIRQTFIKFLEKIPFYGLAAVCIDDDNVRQILPKINKRYVTYGLSEDAELRAVNYKTIGLSSEFEVIYKDKNYGKIVLTAPGKHNMLNSLASIAICMELGLTFEQIQNTLSNYKGVQRRFQIKHDINNILVVDDYAHHPSELKATLAAARDSWNKRIIAIFQPHRYSRTKLFAEEFGSVFCDADEIILTDIYAASEKPIEGISSELILDSLKKNGKKIVRLEKNKKEIVDYVVNKARPDDIILTLGAGDIWEVSEQISRELDIKFKG